MRKRHSSQRKLPQTPETTKPAKRRALRCSNMAEAMGFELMDLLQSTVFKTDMKTAAGQGLEPSFLSETCHFQRLYRPHSTRVQIFVSELIFTLPRRPADQIHPICFTKSSECCRHTCPKWRQSASWGHSSINYKVA